MTVLAVFILGISPGEICSGNVEFPRQKGKGRGGKGGEGEGPPGRTPRVRGV